MYCNKCGNKLNDGALFCAKCGNKIEDMTVLLTPDSASDPSSVPVQKIPAPDEGATIINQPMPEIVSQTVAQPVPQPSAPQIPQPKPQPVAQPIPQPVPARVNPAVPIPVAKLKEDSASSGKKKKSDPVITILIILIVLLLLVGVGLAAVYFVTSRDSGDEEITETIDEDEGDGEDGDVDGEPAPDDEPTAEPTSEVTDTADVTTEVPVDEPEEIVLEVRDSNEADYGNVQVLDYSMYLYYNSGKGDFAYYYPGSLFSQATYSTSRSTGFYGIVDEQNLYASSDGGFVCFTLSQRTDSRPFEDLAAYVHDNEGSFMYDPVDIKYSVSTDRCLVVMSGYTDSSRSAIFYNLTMADGKYVYQMKVYYPAPTDYEDKKHKDYYIETMYRLCMFGLSSQDARSYEDFEANY